jgi:hypothetical protein
MRREPDRLRAALNLRQFPNFEPFQIFHHAAGIANEMIVRIQESIVMGRDAIQFEFANEAGAARGMERVVYGGA